MVRVKVCGMTREADVDFAVSSGADALGFISGFPASPRNISVERAADLARRVPPFISAVLVTTADVLKRRESELKRSRIDTIQLYGDVPDPDRVRVSLGVRLVRPYLLRTGDVRRAKAAVGGFDALLTDTYRRGLKGGTGAVSDWKLCARIREGILPVPMVLSGGLNPENVAEGIEAVHPFAVDTSSGVESSPGVKDPDRVAEFIRRAKEAGWR